MKEQHQLQKYTVEYFKSFPFSFSPPAKTSRFDFSGRAGASLVDDDYSDDDDEEPESH